MQLKRYNGPPHLLRGSDAPVSGHTTPPSSPTVSWRVDFFEKWAAGQPTRERAPFYAASKARVTYLTAEKNLMAKAEC